MTGFDAARYLNDQPPDEDHLLSALMVDREVELAQARQQLLSVRDGNVRRPVVVVGSARVGKSHLVRHLAASLTAGEEFSLVVPLYLTTGLRSSIAVLREVWRQTYVALTRAVLEQGIGTPERSALAPIDDLVNIFGPVVDGGATKVQTKRALSFSESITGTLKVGFPTLFNRLVPVEVGLGQSQQRSVSDERIVEVAPFEEEALTDLLALAHTVVRDAHPTWTTLLVLDDVDLLKRADQGGFEPDELCQALGTLAQVDGLHVLSTMRRDTYSKHAKVFHLGCNVGPFVDDCHLSEVYERHVAVLGSGEPVFADAFVEELARQSAGRVGVFLANLRQAWLVDPNATSAQEVVLRQFRQLEAEEPELSRILRNAALGGGRLSGDDLIRVRNSYAFRFILEDTTSENAARVEPVLRWALSTTDG